VRIVSLAWGEETVMGSLLERLEAREQAARTRMEGLRAEMDRLAEQVAVEEELLRRLEITRQTVIEVLAGEELPGEDGSVGVDRGPHPDPEGGVGAAARVSRIGMQVPVFGQDGNGHRLPVAYRDVVEVVADAGSLRARQVCQALGVGSEPRHREGMRIKPRAAGRSWLAGRGLRGPVRLCAGRGWQAGRWRLTAAALGAVGW
jgi:hypothetical protein